MNMANASDRSADTLEGLRLLLVEDDFLIAHALKTMLEEFGCEVIGPIPSLEQGQRVVASSEIHGGVLDVNIRGGTSSTIARMLEERGAPFLFVTGYASPPLRDADLLARRRLSKPIDANTLRSALLDEFFGQETAQS